MSTIPHDVIDHLAGIQPADHLSSIRQVRAVAREQAQLSFVNLFDATAVAQSAFKQQDRLLLAVFVATLHQQEDIARFYSDLLDGQGNDQLAVVLKEAALSVTEGPYGDYPAGPLTTENQAGLTYTPGEDTIKALGSTLSAALAHSHLLVFHLRDASPQALQRLIDSGWTTPDIVTLSQLVSFLSFQIRVVTGLRVLAHASQPALA